MKKIIFIAFLAVILFSCKQEKNTVTVAAAADLQYALDDIKADFCKENPDINVEIIYGSSGNAYQQIANKAPFDIYFSADIMYPQKLDSLGLSATKPKLYAIGFLVLWTQKSFVKPHIDLLTSKYVKKIAIANPKHAPYGKRAIEFLKSYNLYKKINNKLVEGENISQAAQFVISGNAEIGILALSLALSPEMTKKGNYILIDENTYSPLEQAYIIIKGSETKKEVLKFYDFIESSQARKQFVKYGFRLPNEL